MRIERPRATGEDLRPRSRQSEASSAPIGIHSDSAIDARLLQMLRRATDGRTGGDGPGAEVLRLAGLAAAVHRGLVNAGSDGATVASSEVDATATIGGHVLETPR